MISIFTTLGPGAWVLPGPIGLGKASIGPYYAYLYYWLGP